MKFFMAFCSSSGSIRMRYIMKYHIQCVTIFGIGAAFLLGTLTWRAFGPSVFFLVATYFVIGTAATKVKMTQKVAQGVAEKKRGRRGPGSVIGSKSKCH
ncbi:hypothetical protein JHK82_031778 [Glycine max]|nr:hypothetical protein JHK85_032435 [Glycine max]KAG4995041.1 hypothetical protein JHK86_031868 [Glycine max]KAG5125041.1 hypothetical protein JHK82_031778 [Glycine max]KAG5146466.1 hypothetical protein JHK84_032009 [Glycine max]KAH1140854.1 hypothetical protein GYH30_057237 [Glycine max]